MWFNFSDMHSGGGLKEKPYKNIYIECHSQQEAEVIFYNRFGHSPCRVTCTCCGEDYSISSDETFEQASAFDRNCRWDDTVKCYLEEPDRQYNSAAQLITVEDYKKLPSVLVIPASEITEDERVGDLPVQGYIWVD